MIRSLPVLAIAIAACSTSVAGETDYRAVPLPDETFEVPQAVFAPLLAGYPESREGQQELSLDVTEQEDGSYAVLLTRTGFLDDSVNGDQQRAVLTATEGGWRVTSLGERWRCQFGRGPSSWTTAPCH